MAARQNVDRISFTVDVLSIKNGRKLGMIRPDEHGYYTVPMAVFGTVTDNRTYYEVEEFVHHITSPDSSFNKLLTDGKLMGELGHPMIALLPEDKQLIRLMLIDEKQVSHNIGKLWTGEKLETGGKIVYGKVKPTGPNGDYLKQSLDDPCLNTSFSLRSIAQSRQENGITIRKIRQLITFDYVNGGGYQEAAKRYSPGVESSRIDIPLDAKLIRETAAAMETVNNTELNELFGATEVTIGTKRTTFLSKEAAFQDENGRLRSVFTSLIGV